MKCMGAPSDVVFSAPAKAQHNRQPHPKSQSNLQYCVSSLVDTPYCIHVLDCFSD